MSILTMLETIELSSQYLFLSIIKLMMMKTAQIHRQTYIDSRIE